MVFSWSLVSGKTNILLTNKLFSLTYKSLQGLYDSDHHTAGLIITSLYLPSESLRSFGEKTAGLFDHDKNGAEKESDDQKMAEEVAEKADKAGQAIAGGVKTAKENVAETGESMANKINSVCK